MPHMRVYEMKLTSPEYLKKDGRQKAPAWARTFLVDDETGERYVAAGLLVSELVAMVTSPRTVIPPKLGHVFVPIDELRELAPSSKKAMVDQLDSRITESLKQLEEPA